MSYTAPISASFNLLHARVCLKEPSSVRTFPWQRIISVVDEQRVVAGSFNVSVNWLCQTREGLATFIEMRNLGQTT